MKRFMQFPVLSIMLVAVGCTHTKTTSANIKPAQPRSRCRGEEGGGCQRAGPQKILAMKDITLADLYSTTRGKGGNREDDRLRGL